jgi:YesN/AraC family two-component response regulator
MLIDEAGNADEALKKITMNPLHLVFIDIRYGADGFL